MYLNSRNPLDPYNISYIWLCACPCFRRMLLEIPVLSFIMNIATASVHKYICVGCDWFHKELSVAPDFHCGIYSSGESQLFLFMSIQIVSKSLS